MERTKTVEQFVQFLSDAPDLPLVFNPYSDNDPFGAVRRKNLQIYLENMKILKPKVLLVGEAPGYNGCRYSGIPFTSERIMMQGIEYHSIFGNEHYNAT